MVYVYIATAVTAATADVVTDIANRTELKAWVKIRQLKEFKVILITVYY